MSKPDGGPAFPQSVAMATGESPRASYDFADGPGMSLRDWFAGQALVGLLSSESDHESVIADKAYRIADAMLKEREQP